MHLTLHFPQEVKEKKNSSQQNTVSLVFVIITLFIFSNKRALLLTQTIIIYTLSRYLKVFCNLLSTALVIAK
jgi:hypothetical protein